MTIPARHAWEAGGEIVSIASTASIRVEDTAGTVLPIVKHAYHFTFALLARPPDTSATIIATLVRKDAAPALPPALPPARSASPGTISIAAPAAMKDALPAFPILHVPNAATATSCTL